MPLIANTYEIIRKIGAGGGGVVYEGRHLRLNKKIALKQDIRGLHADPQVLRQEVDTLKNLNHMYLPQVYDFLQEDGAVYTVMDFIEGESLDKLIERGETVELPQVIEWACELLEALAYLHSRPPYGILHSDIKPANIMITPQKEIRLIDFNIALALGEDNTVRVGRSHGYASPEHYGIDFAASADSGGTTSGRFSKGRKKGASSAANTATDSVTRGTTSSSYVVTTSDGKTIKLDRRSDIYGVGATLYHLLTGVRPAKADKVNEITPITRFAINENMAAIVQKAMSPNPDQRYQSAEEMLHALEHIRASDRRSKRHRRHMAEAAALITLLLIAGAAMTFIGQRQIHQLDYYKSCVTDSMEALRKGDVDGAIDAALLALPESPGLYDPPEPLPEARLALSNALGTYDLRGFYKPWRTISLPSEPAKLRMSPDGTKIALQVRESGAWSVNVFDLARDGRMVLSKEMEPSALSEILFYDDNTILYAGRDGISSCNLETGELNWSTGASVQGPGNAGELVWSTTQTAAGCLALSRDGNVAATVYMDTAGNEWACFFNTANGLPARSPVSFNGKKLNRPVLSFTDASIADMTLFVLNEDGSRLAASFSDGSFAVFVLPEDAYFSSEPSNFTHFGGCFCGGYFALSRFQADPAETRFEIYNADMASVITPLTGEDPYWSRYHVQTDGTAFYLSSQSRVSRINLNDSSELSRLIAGMEEPSVTITGFYHAGDRTVVWTSNNEYQIFNEYGQCLETGRASDDDMQIQRAVIGGGFLAIGNNTDNFLLIRRLDNHADKLFFHYDSAYKHYESRLRADGEAAVLFGAAGFRIANADGSFKEVPWDVGQTLDPQFRRVGSRDFLRRVVTEETLEILYKNGDIEGYSVVDGTLLYREQTQAPDSQYRTTFETEDYRVTWTLGQPPEIYQGDTLLKTLSSITHPAYAAQVGDCLIIQYTTMESGKQLAVMLDGNLEEIANLPDLSDILPDGTLIFDDHFGNLRKSRIYSIDELISMAKDRR